MRSERMLPPLRRPFFHNLEPGVGFEAGDDPATGGIERGPPSVVVIAELEDVTRARLIGIC